MSNEANITTLLGNDGDPVEYTVIDGAAIPKNSLMQLSSSPGTITISSGDGEIFVGILAAEKKLSDGVTKVACITNCIADLTTKGSGGQAVLGQQVKLAGENLVDVQDETSIIKLNENVGMAQDTLGASATGSFRIKC